jgi:hypothetical protein
MDDDDVVADKNADAVDTSGLSKLHANIAKKGSNSYYYAQYVISTSLARKAKWY